MGFFSVGHVFLLFFFFCLFPYFSQVPGPIFTELPDISSRDSFLKVKVIEVKGQISVTRQSLVRFT